MASTYSTNLGLELITTGEQAGTWGTTTNLNLGTLIEQAISGYVTQAITDGSGANTTITIPDGATGVARNMFIEMTGALTFSTTSLVVPADRKLYFIYNNTTGGFAVTVKVTGLTGVSVPNGRKVILVCNGTDIVEAHNAISGNATVGGTLVVTGATTSASLSLGTALPVASGGTGVTTSTGTGNTVLSISPALTTPNLGTPSAGTLTNCTGYPAANISGLGTGVATFLATPSSANLAAAVTGETGTGALVFGTSPTLATPVISSIVNTGTLTLPTSTDTLVGRATTDTLTNKTINLASNTLTATSAQLATAVSDETGSGALVFATNPALTTPNLGTPSAGTLTNCTFPTLNQNTTGNAATATTSAALTNGGTLNTPGSGTLTNCTFPTLNQNTTGNAATATTSAALTNGGTLNTPGSGTLTNCTGLPIVAGTTGTLSVARGGTGVTGSTGSGSVVLSTSPSLTTPALGTPSSGNLSSCTFPTLNQNTTGSSGSCTGNSATATTSSALTNNSPLNTPSSGNLSNCTNLPLVSLTAGVSGTLPVANGGTGVTGATGSGSVVLSASPQLTGIVSVGGTSVVGLEIGDTTTGAGMTTAYLDFHTGANIDYDARIVATGGTGSLGDADFDVECATFDITGALSKGSGSFKISHPLPEKTDTHYLVHSFIEGPKADLIYSGMVRLVSGYAHINIDAVSGMTAGTFEVLCRDVRRSTTNESGFAKIKSEFYGSSLHIYAENQDCVDEIFWQVIGERKDPHMYETSWTDDEGHVMVEPKKAIK